MPSKRSVLGLLIDDQPMIVGEFGLEFEKRKALDLWVRAINEKGGFGLWCADVAFEMAQLEDILLRHGETRGGERPSAPPRN